MAHSKGIVDRLLESAERDRLADAEHREYNILRTRILGTYDNTGIASVSARVTKFVQDEPNPVYADALVNLLMEQGYRVLERLQGDSLTYDLMITRMVTRNVRATVMAWRGTMDLMESDPEG